MNVMRSLLASRDVRNWHNSSLAAASTTHPQPYAHPIACECYDRAALNCEFTCVRPNQSQLLNGVTGFRLGGTIRMVCHDWSQGHLFLHIATINWGQRWGSSMDELVIVMGRY